MSTENPTADGSPSDPSTPATEPKPAPRPRPRPGPRPGTHNHNGPGPVGTARPHAPSASFGRIDPDGSVWLLTSQGPRQIGSWQAGTPKEGMEHFTRRYEDLATEVTVLEERLAGPSGDLGKTEDKASALLDSLDSAAVVGDIPALHKRLTTVIDGIANAKKQRSHDREEARAQAISRKEVLCAEAEEIGEHSTAWKIAGDRLRAILTEWKSIKGIDRTTDDALWKRYSTAREAFNRRRGAHFAELDRERAGARSKKEEIIEAAEALVGSTDWGPTSARFRQLLDEWKAAGRASRDTDDSLWARFKAAQDAFFSARNTATAQRDEEFAANAAAKRELLAEAEKTVDPHGDLDAARRAFGSIRERWDAIGKVPREDMGPLEKSIRDIENSIKSAQDDYWQRTDPEVAARAEQFQARVAQLEEQAAKADARGKSTEAEQLRAQAKQWSEWASAASDVVADR